RQPVTIRLTPAPATPRPCRPRATTSRRAPVTPGGRRLTEARRRAKMAPEWAAPSWDVRPHSGRVRPILRRISMFRCVMLTCAMVGLLGLVGRAPAQGKKVGDDPLKKDAKALQGSWERVVTSVPNKNDKVKRVVKEFKGDKVTVTSYGDKDEVLGSRRLTFK